MAGSVLKSKPLNSDSQTLNSDPITSQAVCLLLQESINNYMVGSPQNSNTQDLTLSQLCQETSTSLCYLAICTVLVAIISILKHNYH